MIKKQKDEFYKLFAEAFHDVVMPLLENVATKDDIAKIRAEMATKDDLNNAVDRLERRIGKIDDRLDRHGKMLDDHEKEIKKVCTHIGVASL